MDNPSKAPDRPWAMCARGSEITYGLFKLCGSGLWVCFAFYFYFFIFSAQTVLSNIVKSEVTMKHGGCLVLSTPSLRWQMHRDDKNTPPQCRLVKALLLEDVFK